MRRFEANEFRRPWLLLCEGEADKRFFDKLTEARNLEPNFYVQFPDRRGGGTGGRTLFGHYLSTVYATSESFRSNVKAVLIVSDKDDDAAASFEEVKTQLRNADGFPVPTNEKELARQAGYPDVVVLMIPLDQCGNLETVCLRAAYHKWAFETELNTFTAAVPARNWGISKQSKMRLQTLIAATCKAAPDTSFASHWHHADDYHLPLDHPCFDDLADFLRRFGALIAQ